MDVLLSVKCKQQQDRMRRTNKIAVVAVGKTQVVQDTAFIGVPMLLLVYFLFIQNKTFVCIIITVHRLPGPHPPPAQSSQSVQRRL